MNIFDIPLIAAALEAAYRGLTALVAILQPIVGGASAALAILLVTVLVRAAMIPLGRAQVRAEFARRRLAQRLRELQRRYAARPEVLRTKTLELYRAEGTHPLADTWTLLVQLPVVSLLYAELTRVVIAGQSNMLLTAQLGGVPLGSSLLAAIGTSPSLPGLLVVGAVLTALALTATLSRRQALRLAVLDGSATPLVRAVSLASYLSVVFALFAPLGAGLYLAVSTAWTLAERAILRRTLAPGG